MTKIAYNNRFGGFSLSRAAILRGRKISGDSEWGGCVLKNDDYGYLRDHSRTDPILIRVIEELGIKANGPCANLAITDIPAGSQYRIDEYDGNERVMTIDDYDWQTA